MATQAQINALLGIMANVPAARADIASMLTNQQAFQIIRQYMNRSIWISQQKSQKPQLEPPKKAKAGGLTVGMLDLNTFISEYGNHGKLTVSRPYLSPTSSDPNNIAFDVFECKFFDLREYPHQDAAVKCVFVGDDITVDVLLEGDDDVPTYVPPVDDKTITDAVSDTRSGPPVGVHIDLPFL